MLDYFDSNNLTLPEYYKNNRPAIIRPCVDLSTFFPVEIDQETRRAIISKVQSLERTELNKEIEAAIPFGMFFSGKKDNKFTYQGSFLRGSTANTSVHTIPNVTFGTADADRIVVVRLPAVKGGWTSVTIGGIAATLQLSTSSKGNGFAYAKVPTGTSGDVVLTRTGNNNGNSMVNAFSFLGKLPVIDVRNAQTAAGTSTITIADIIVKAGGVLFFTFYKLENTSTAGISYTGIDPFTTYGTDDVATALRAAVITETVSTNDILITRPVSTDPYTTVISFEGL